MWSLYLVHTLYQPSAALGHKEGERNAGKINLSRPIFTRTRIMGFRLMVWAKEIKLYTTNYFSD